MVRRRRSGWIAFATAATVGAACAPAWPGPQPDSPPAAAQKPMGGPAPRSPASADDPAGILPGICIGATGWSAGQLGRSVLLRAERDGDGLNVGVFVYWTTERPWGANWQSFTLLPALLVDAIYTHFLFVLPGLQRAIYGPGDVEGVRISFRRRAGGVWTPTAATADDAAHREVALAPEDFIADDGRLVFLTDVWSHQLAAKGGRQFAREHGERLTCFAGNALRLLDDEDARAFRLGSPDDPRRAPPAWRGRAVKMGIGAAEQ